MGRKIYYDIDKPMPYENYQLDKNHWASQGMVGCWLFNEANNYYIRNLITNNCSVTQNAIMSENNLLINPTNAGVPTEIILDIRVSDLAPVGAGSNSKATVFLKAKQIVLPNGYADVPFLSYSASFGFISGGGGLTGMYGRRCGWLSGTYAQDSDKYLVNTHAVSYTGSWTSYYINYYRNSILNDRQQLGSDVSNGNTNYLRIGNTRTDWAYCTIVMLYYGYIYNYQMSDGAIKDLSNTPYQMFYRELPIFYSIPSGAYFGYFNSNVPIIGQPMGGRIT